jgi:hypothetical protein
VIAVTGRAWQTCEKSRCRGEWLDVVLAPGATITSVAAAHAMPRAVAILLADALDRATDALLVERTAPRPGHLQLVLSGHRAHRYAYAPLTTLVRLALERSPAAPLSKAG